ncbi:MAG: hypothetical protein KZQ94_10240 [Candidatus Thiodiazotropha sp. (ex Troendleina suluensis)]|nr:hypothetical protein [Candidatus Thiodiazotropha sp. (ex Troendleina suluensis)]
MDNKHAFLTAWKRGVMASGTPGLFYNGDMLDRATHLHRLAPKIKDIAKRISTYPKSQASFLSALVSFYNPEEGARLAKKVGCNGLGDIALNLSTEQRFILADLLIHHEGW